MNTRTTVIALIIILAAVFIFFGGEDKERTNARFHPFISSDNITQITIKNGTRQIVLSARNSRWYISDNNSLEIYADPDKILPLFDFVNEARIVQKITKKESAYADFSITGSVATQLHFHTADGSSTVFYIGKDKDRTAQFVRKGDDPYVYLVSRHITVALEKDRWFFKKLLNYAPDDLEQISYTCEEKKQITIFRDNETDGLTISKIPEGKQPAELDKIVDAFKAISVSEFLPRSKKIETVPVVTHNLHFKTGGIITLDFLKSTEEKSNTHYLEITVVDGDVKNEEIAYLKEIAGAYRFQLPWFDKTKYMKAYDDFFVDKPLEQKSEELRVQPTVPAEDEDSSGA